MNHSNRNYILILLIAACPVVALSGGSVYSRYGFGDLLRSGDSRTYAMGGTGIALLDDGFINGLNPAGLARISLTRFSTGFEYNNFLSKDETGSSVYSTGAFQGLSFAVPISPENGIVASADFTPYSKVSYGITSSLFDNSTQSIQNRTFYGSGGLSTMGLGLSLSPIADLYIGARFNYVYGRTRQYQTISFDSSSYVPSNFDRSAYYSGFTGTVGAIYTGLANLVDVPALRPLSIGVSVTTPGSLSTNIQRTYPTTSYFATDSTISEDGTAGIPLSIGFGLSYVYQTRYRFLADIVTENWGSTDYLGAAPVNLRNSFRGSLGFEVIPIKAADTYWKRITYRAGLAYHSTYYQIQGTGINEFLLSGGLGLPMAPESQLNIGLQIGLRGSTDNHLQRDTIVRLSVAISACEIWFLKFEED